MSGKQTSEWEGGYGRQRRARKRKSLSSRHRRIMRYTRQPIMQFIYKTIEISFFVIWVFMLVSLFCLIQSKS